MSDSVSSGTIKERGQTPTASSKSSAAAASSSSRIVQKQSQAQGSVIAMSESVFFPISTDSIWKSATIVHEPQPPESFDILESKDTLQYDVDSSDGKGETSLNQSGMAQDIYQKTPRNSSLLLQESSVNAEFSGTTKDGKGPARSRKFVKSSPRAEECLGKLSKPKKPHLIPATGAESTAEEIEVKLESGLRFLDHLAHTSSSSSDELKCIYGAYYNFAQTLFHDIKQKQKSEDSPEYSEYNWKTLEDQKEEIYEQEALFEEEIRNYKQTKHELEQVAKELEEAAKAYRTPDVLENISIPKDVKLSSSSEYVAEVEELQSEILKKQEKVKQIQMDIQCHRLPKNLVDSICESHRQAVQTLRDISDETTYLRETIKRLDVKYMYDMQIG